MSRGIATGLFAYISIRCALILLQARELLDGAGRKYTTVDATGDNLNVLQLLTARSSVPSIWIKGKYVGGHNDGPEPWMGIKKIVAAGKLDELLE